MIFDFPGRILTTDLRHELAPLFALLREELDEVVDLRVTLKGVRGGKQYRLGKSGASDFAVVFDRVPGSAGGWRREARPWTMVEMPVKQRKCSLGVLLDSVSGDEPLQTLSAWEAAAQKVNRFRSLGHLGRDRHSSQVDDTGGPPEPIEDAASLPTVGDNGQRPSPRSSKTGTGDMNEGEKVTGDIWTRGFDFIALELELTEEERRLVIGNDPDAASLRMRELVRIGSALITLLPAEGRAAQWLRAPNDWLNGGIAADVLFSSDIDGLRRLRQYLEAQTV